MNKKYKLKWTKTKIGEIAYAPKIDGKLPKIPEDTRIGMPWELLQIYIEEKKALTSFPRYVYIWCGWRACGLDGFDDDSMFVADVRVVGDQDDLVRGVFLVRKKK